MLQHYDSVTILPLCNLMKAAEIALKYSRKIFPDTYNIVLSIFAVIY